MKGCREVKNSLAAGHKPKPSKQIHAGCMPHVKAILNALWHGNGHTLAGYTYLVYAQAKQIASNESKMNKMSFE